MRLYLLLEEGGREKVGDVSWCHKYVSTYGSEWKRWKRSNLIFGSSVYILIYSLVDLFDLSGFLS